jgi:hypothetical protein
MKPYFITGLPRSRTAWLANLLTWNDSFCFHEATFGCGSMDEFKAVLEGAPLGTRYVGDSDPNLGLIAESIVQTFPGCRVVAIHRPLADCLKSEWEAMTWDGNSAFENTTQEHIRTLMEQASLGIAHILRSLPKERQMMVRFEDLDKPDVIRGIWGFCAPSTPFPTARYEMLQDLRVTQIFTKVINRHPTMPFQKLIENAAVLENRAAEPCRA